MGSIPGLGRSPGGENANHPVFLPEESLDRGTWQATVHGVSNTWTQLSRAEIIIHNIDWPLPPTLWSSSSVFLESCVYSNMF